MPKTFSIEGSDWVLGWLCLTFHTLRGVAADNVLTLVLSHSNGEWIIDQFRPPARSFSFGEGKTILEDHLSVLQIQTHREKIVSSEDGGQPSRWINPLLQFHS